MKQALVTIKQAVELRSLGFDDWASHRDLYLSVPTVDEAIDWIRRKFNVVIYNSTEPVVRNKKIRYGYAVKYCNKHWGWNQRVYISRGEWSFDHYAAKRMAITKALKWIKKSKKETLSAKQPH